MLNYLEANRAGATFLVATTSANQAAPIILHTGQAVMAMGGFTGSDPILTTDALARLVQHGAVHYFLVGRLGGPGDSSYALTSWIITHGRAVPVGAWGGATLLGFGGSRLYEVTSAGAAR